MLVVAQFNYPEGATNIAGQAELAQAIRAEAQKARLTHLRVEAATAALHADDRAGAEQLGARYNASLVVWGDVAGERTSVSFLNRRGIPPLTAQDVPINQLARREIADPPNYSRYAMDDFPDQLSFLALLAVGQSLAIDQNYDAAIQAIGQAVISGAPGKPIGGIDDAYFRLGWLQQAAKNNPFQARPVYGQALALAPNAAIYNDRGVARWLLRDLKGALEDLDQAITLDPRYALAYTNQGAVRFAQGDLKGALADYDQAIALDPKFAFAYVNRGLDRKSQGDLDGARGS